MKKLLLAIILIATLQVFLVSGLTTGGNFTNPTQGSDVTTSIVINWSEPTPNNVTTYINYYNLTLYNSSGALIKEFNNASLNTTEANITGLTGSGLRSNVTYNKLMTSFSDWFDVNSDSTPRQINYTIYYYNNNYTFQEFTGVDSDRILIPTIDSTRRIKYIETRSNGNNHDFESRYRVTTKGNGLGDYWNLTTETVSIGEYSLKVTTSDNFNDLLISNVSFNLTRGSKRLTTNFIDESTGSAVAGTINIDFISTGYTLSTTTTSGSSTLLLQPETYTIRYSATGYTTRFYYISFSNSTDITLNLYMINNTATSNITIKIIDENAENVDGAYVKALKYDISSNSYLLQEIGETGTTGQTTLHLTLGDEFYKFMVELNGVLYLTTTPAYITSTSYTFQIQTSEDFTGKLSEYQGITKSLDFLNATNQFRLTYSISDGVSSQVCLYILKLGSVGYHNQSCTTSNSATILLGITPVNGSTYSASAYYWDTTGNKMLLDSESVSFYKNEVDFGRFGLFIQILLTTFAAFAIMVDLSIALVVVPGSLLLGYFLGLHSLALAPIVVLTVLGLIIAVMIGRRGA